MIIDGDNRVIITNECFFIVTFIVTDRCLPLYYWRSFHFKMYKGKESLPVVSRSFKRLKLLEDTVGLIDLTIRFDWLDRISCFNQPVF